MVFKEAIMSGVDNFSISLVIALYKLNYIRILVLTHNLLEDRRMDDVTINNIVLFVICNK